MYLQKFVHSDSGKILMSILLGFGLATLFRSACKGANCRIYAAPPMEEIRDKIYRSGPNKCVKYVESPSKCRSDARTISFV